MSATHPAFQYNQYMLKRQVFALTGKVRLYSPDGALQLFSEQKMFRLREDIRVYNNESKAEFLLHIQARSIIDFSAAYDVVDGTNGERAGTLRRKGMRSMLRDEWEVLDASERPIGVLIEDSAGLALARRFLSGLIPQNYDILRADGSRIADIRQPFNPFRYELALDFTMDTVRALDRRMGLAAGILLAIVEGRQS